MAKANTIHIAVVLGFLATIFSAGVLQTTLDLSQREWPQAVEVFRQTPTVPNLRNYERNLEDRSWLVKRVRPWFQYLQFAMLADAGEKALVGRDGWLFYKPGFKYFTERPQAQKAVGRQPLPAIVDFRDQLAWRGIRLVLMPVPNKESVYPEKLDRRVTAGQCALCPQTRALLGDLQAAGIDVVDLFDVFSKAKQAHPSASPFYLVQDSHWSPAGIEVAAEAAAKKLFEHDCVSPGPHNYATQPRPVKRCGDVLRMLQIPALERRFAPEEISCAQVFQPQDDKLYADSKDSEVLVLGDSFLRVFEQDEPGQAGFIAHLARKLKQPLTTLVSDGGASTLVRQELYRRPALLKGKKVVLWEFVERDIRFGTEGWQLVPLPPSEAALANSSQKAK